MEFPNIHLPDQSDLIIKIDSPSHNNRNSPHKEEEFFDILSINNSAAAVKPFLLPKIDKTVAICMENIMTAVKYNKFDFPEKSVTELLSLDINLLNKSLVLPLFSRLATLCGPVPIR